MKYKEITSDTENIFVALDPNELRTDFDTGITKVTLEYFQDQPESQAPLYEIKIEMTGEFIEDTYRLEGKLSEETKIKAALDLGTRVYQEKRGIPKGFELVRALKADHQLRYIPRIDMQATQS